MFIHVDLNKQIRDFIIIIFQSQNERPETSNFLFFQIELCAFPYLIEYFAVDPMSMIMFSVSLK